MTTVRFAVSPGTMFDRLIREAAALLSFDIVSVADPNELLGLVVVAVKLALDLSDVTVRPMRMSAESAMPARRVVDLRICWFPFLSASPDLCFRGRLVRGELSPAGDAQPSVSRGRPDTSLVWGLAAAAGRSCPCGGRG